MDVQYRGRFGTEQEGLQIFLLGRVRRSTSTRRGVGGPIHIVMDHDDIPTDIWIFYCVRQLKMHWRTVDPEQLEELAADLAREPHLRQMSPQAAAAKWMEPVLVPRR